MMSVELLGTVLFISIIIFLLGFGVGLHSNRSKKIKVIVVNQHNEPQIGINVYTKDFLTITDFMGIAYTDTEHVKISVHR